MLRFTFYTLVSLLFLAAVASAQTATKIGVVNSRGFMDEKAGITRLVNSAKALSIEFEPTRVELETMNKRLEALAKEVENLRAQATKGIPVDEKTLQAKYDEAEKTQRDLKFKQEDATRRYDKRRQAMLSPVMDDIGKALNEYAKQNQFTLIFDIAKDDVGLLVAVGDDKINITKEFITYYNAKPTPPTAAK